MAPRPPADAVVALRSLSRRFRALFAGLGDDESPDDLAHRNGSDGHSALDHIAAATRTLTFLGRAVEQALVDDDPVLHPAVLDPVQRHWPDATGSVGDAIVELEREAGRVAARVEHVGAKEWSREARVAGQDATVSPLTILWDAVDSAIDHLKAAQKTLAEVRRR